MKFYTDRVFLSGPSRYDHCCTVTETGRCSWSRGMEREGEGRRERGRERGRGKGEGGREEGREGGRKGGREEGRESEREGGSESIITPP